MRAAFDDLSVAQHQNLVGLPAGPVEWSGGASEFRQMASGVSALSGIVANSPRVMPIFAPPPLFMTYGGFSPVRLEVSLIILHPSEAVPGCV